MEILHLLGDGKKGRLRPLAVFRVLCLNLINVSNTFNIFINHSQLRHYGVLVVAAIMSSIILGTYTLALL